jgi:hypothetical protein
MIILFRHRRLLQGLRQVEMAQAALRMHIDAEELHEHAKAEHQAAAGQQPGLPQARVARRASLDVMLTAEHSRLAKLEMRKEQLTSRMTGMVSKLTAGCTVARN